MIYLCQILVLCKLRMLRRARGSNPRTRLARVQPTTNIFSLLERNYKLSITDSPLPTFTRCITGGIASASTGVVISDTTSIWSNPVEYDYVVNGCSNNINYNNSPIISSIDMEAMAEKMLEMLYGKLAPKVVVRCGHCSQWGARHCACTHCGAPIE